MKGGRMCFILGNPRSGTSLLRLMLDAHSSIVSPPESGFLLWWFEKYKAWTQADSKDPDRVDAYLKDLRSSRKIETWQLDYDALRALILSQLPAGYAELSELVYHAYGRRTGKNAGVFVDKNNYYLKHIGDILRIFPEASFIHIVRDGRDVACSYLKLVDLKTDSSYKPVLAADIETIAHEWVKNTQVIENTLEPLGKDRKILVRYEDLITRTADELSRLCAFLGVAYEKNMLNYYETVHEPSETLDWKKKTLERPDPDNAGKYRKELKASEIELFNRIAQQQLDRFGYNS